MTALPRHVGIIMDGNGRWAQLRGQPRLEGHRVGAESVRDTGMVQQGTIALAKALEREGMVCR